MEAHDFTKVPEWNGNPEESFEILLDDVNGRIPVTRLERWQDFAELLEHEFFNRPKNQLIYRGHRRFDWDLMPTLARVTSNGIIDEQLAVRQLDYFRRAVRGRLTDNSMLLDETEDELWSVGQHHGLMTPLLDWTHSPFVGLFFAFMKEDVEEETDNPYRAIYILNKTFVADDELCPEVRMFEPRMDDHGRLVNQAGLFTFSPYGSTIGNELVNALANENIPDEELLDSPLVLDQEGDIQSDVQASIIAKYICKIYIRNENRESCMKQLRRMNVHHASLFPDVIGASDHCNLIIAEEQREYEIEKKEELVKELVAIADKHEAAEVVGTADQEEVPLFEAILTAYAEDKVEPGRINLIAERLSKFLSQYKVVDWDKRDTTIAGMRSRIRASLRKYGYPPTNRDAVIVKIVELLIEKERADK